MIARLVATGLVAVFVVFATEPASAHVLITDTSKSYGAVLHITPDDDPIAGERATFYFDMQGDLLRQPGSSVTGGVRAPDGTETALNLKVDEALVTTDYVFPVQGSFTLTFTIRTDDGSYTFTKLQRVTRGIAGDEKIVDQHVWAEPLTLTSASALVVLTIIAYNRRNAISRQSR